MNLRAIPLALVLLAVPAIAAPPPSPHDDAWGQIALKIGRALADGIGPRPSGSPAVRAALDSVAGRLGAAGFEVKRHRFGSLSHPGVRVLGRWFLPRLEAIYSGEGGENLYVVIPGRSPEASPSANM